MEYQLSSNRPKWYTGQSVLSKAAAEPVGRKRILPLTLLFLHCLYCWSLCRWSSSNRTPAPPSACTRCSTWTPGMRSTPTGTTTTCRSGTQMLESALARMFTGNDEKSWSGSPKTSWKGAWTAARSCWKCPFSLSGHDLKWVFGPSNVPRRWRRSSRPSLSVPTVQNANPGLLFNRT